MFQLKMWYKIFSIICLSSLPYIMSGLDGDFVFDDSEAILKNKDVISDSWTTPFQNDFWGTDIKSNLSHKSYRPLTILSFRLNYLLSGKILVASHFKITNLFLHIINCILYWFCAQKLIKRRSKNWWLDVPFCSSLLFATHPIHVEGVSGIVGRADLLAALTFFLAFLIYSKRTSSKGFCLVYEVLFQFKQKKTLENRKYDIQISDSVIYRIVFLMGCAICLLYGRWTVMGQAKPEFKAIDNPAAFSDSILTKVSTYNYIYFLNLLLLIWPQWLCYDWSMGCIPLIENITDFRIIFVLFMYLYGLNVLYFQLNYLLSGKILVASHFKITNLFLHIINCILYWFCAQKLIKRRSKNWWLDVPFCSSLLFATHPIHVEGVSGIVGRADLLAALTFFLAFLIYSKRTSSKVEQILCLVVVVILSGVSMLCKENGVTVLGFCLVYEVLFQFKQKKTLENRKYDIQISDSVIYRIVFLMGCAICLLYGRWTVMGQAKPEFKAIDNPAAFSDSILTKVSTYNYIYFLNLLLLIWPQWLCYDWSMGCIPLIENITDFRIIFVLFMYLYGFFILKTFADYKVRRHTAPAVFLIAIPFLPAANIFYPVGFVIAERVLYIPSAGYCLLIAIGYGQIVQWRKLRKIGISLFLLLLLSFTLKTWKRSDEWQTEYKLFTSGLFVCPLSAKVHYNVAKVADAKQNTAWALQEYREAIRLYPEYYQSMNNLANLLKNDNQYYEAELYLRRAIYLKEEFPAAWMNLGIVLANTKRYNESETAYRMALKYRRKYPDCLYNLGNLYLELNQTQEAMENWFACIKLNNKHNLAWTNLLALLDNSGEISKAIEVIPDALTSLPDSASVNFAVANIYGKLDRYEDAERHFKRAIKLFNKRVQAIHYANLGVLYHRWKKYHLALTMYEKALKIDPNFASAIKNIKSVKRYISS